MTSRAPKTPGRKDPGREDRLKAALKANLARRKAQARARCDDAETTAPEQAPDNEN